MKSFLRSLLAGLLAVTLTSPVAVAQERPAFSEEELDQMLAPIALYPDSLLSQILMASTYPLEVVQAARWSRANSHLKGDDAVKAVEGMDWDPSVKSLVAFPQILHRMDERLDWTQRLGEAFLAQEPHVLDAIQGLRQRAAAAGNLDSNEQMRVTRQDDAILIEPVRTEAVYVPYYDPAVVYGPWWWPAYPPVYWGPFPGYYAAPAFAPGFFWGPAIVVSTGFFFGHCNWRHRHVTVVHKHTQVVHSRFGKPHTVVTSNNKPVAWKHDPAHRKGVPYRHAGLRKGYGRPGMHGGNGRRDNHKPEAALATRDNQAGRPAGFRDGRSGEPTHTANGRGARSSPRPAPAAPAARLTQRPDSVGNSKVLSFQGRRPTSQPAPAAPAARLAPRPDSGASNSVRRFQGRTSTPRPAPAALTAHQGPRRAAAAPQRNGQQAAAPQLRFRPPAASSNGNRGQFNRQMMTPQRSAVPSPQARAGNSALRMGNGSFRGGNSSGGRGRGSGSFR